VSQSFTLFELSWEVCNKVGGIHTVLSTKAKTLVERFGDDYIAIGPWLLGEEDRQLPFVEDHSFAPFTESCRAMGLPVRVGRWTIPGRPRVILIEFSKLYEQKDDVLASMWEDHAVDSISGEWDYVEPVLFGWAAGKVIERWWEEYLAPYRRRAVVQAHEWMTASSLLYLAPRVPSMGTVFTTHATKLGRTLSALGHSPEDGLGDHTAKELAETHNVSAKHSLEGVAARSADVFTTVSEITAREAELLHERVPSPLLPNGIDLDVIDAIAAAHPREVVRPRLERMARAFLGKPVDGMLHMAISGRYEYHNKGLDVLLEALSRMDADAGRGIVLWVLVPAGNSGLKSDLLERIEQEEPALGGPIGISTHHLFEADSDPVRECCLRLGLDNTSERRVHVIQVPIYLKEGDGFLDMSYEAVLRAMDLTSFPSFYEPWGYAPQESLALGVPTITSDFAGFGRWADELGLGVGDGVTVLQRIKRSFEDVVTGLASTLSNLVAEESRSDERVAACRSTAQRAAWSDLISNYESAFSSAIVAIEKRGARGVPQTRRPVQPHQTDSTEGKRPKLVSFDVANTLPEELRGLERLAQNLWWSWDTDAQTIFEDISKTSWETSGHNPVAFLQQAFRDDLEAAAADQPFVERLKSVLARFEAHLEDTPPSWPAANGGVLTPTRPVAYFSAEFGLHESLRIYSGGLGILAGDHLKAASDIALPLVGVGLFYRRGYLRQRVTPSGEQIALELENDPAQLPMRLVRDDAGEPMIMQLSLPGRTLHLRAWIVAVGRVTLYLLDADVPSNEPEDRKITRHLYGGDSEMRLLQEIALGRGGARLLRRLGVKPTVWHMNEGHAAFLSLERMSYLVRRQGLTFEEARELVRATGVFTTHTPVPAGHDRFGEDMMRRYFADAAEWSGVPWDRFYALGRPPQAPIDEPADFNMTHLAMAFASKVNGVSQLHGEVSRELLQDYWPGLLRSEIPVNAVTNGVHLSTWTNPDLARELGATDRSVRGEDFRDHAKGLDSARLWDIRQAAKRSLMEEVRERLRQSYLQQSDSPILLARLLEGLDDGALVIGFARRFAPYKRAHLVFSDRERLRSILASTDKPVVLLVAGKAHPADGRGKEILKGIVNLGREDDFAGRVVFIEDYDIALARKLVQGVDVWLNTPTRMMEASGTSGMKASANGALNLSIADGWWPEATDPLSGWTIAGSRLYEDQELQDQADATALYRLLEEEVVPTFFGRDADGIPQAWLERSRAALACIPPFFDTARMVREYAECAYLPQADGDFAMRTGRYAGAKARAAERSRLQRAFGGVRILSATLSDLSDVRVGDPITVEAEIELGGLSPADLCVELVLGHDTDSLDLASAHVQKLEASEPVSDGRATFKGTRQVERSGRYAYGLRVRTRYEDTGLQLMRWA
jgi:phosphorylase/glycogen(starch) synthase